MISLEPHNGHDDSEANKKQFRSATIYNQRVSLGQYDKHHVNKTKDKTWKNYTTANQWLGRRLRLVREMQVFELLEKRKSPINGKQIKVIPK